MAYTYGTDGTKRPLVKKNVRENYVGRSTTSSDDSSSSSNLIYGLLFFALILGLLLWLVPKYRNASPPEASSSSIEVPSEGEPVKFGFRFY